MENGGDGMNREEEEMEGDGGGGARNEGEAGTGKKMQFLFSVCNFCFLYFCIVQLFAVYSGPCVSVFFF